MSVGKKTTILGVLCCIGATAFILIYRHKVLPSPTIHGTEDSLIEYPRSQTKEPKTNKRKPVAHSDCGIRRQKTSFSLDEERKISACMSSAVRDARQGSKRFWTGTTQYIRHSYHKYLTKSSWVIDIGGNKGEDSQAIIDKYHPSKYVIVEPIDILYEGLVKMYQNRPEIRIFNIGVGAKNATFKVKYFGNGGDATSQFVDTKDAKNLKTLRVIDAVLFFSNTLEVGCNEYDLITINCEGCEYEVLEALLNTNLHRYLRHIQFATHPTLKGLKNPYGRYCRINQLLQRTHRVGYMFKFCWETWIRKDV